MKQVIVVAKRNNEYKKLTFNGGLEIAWKAKETAEFHGYVVTSLHVKNGPNSDKVFFFKETK